MKNLKPIVWILVTAVTFSCNIKERKIDTYDTIKKDLKGVELERVTPHASPEEFEREVNNGGLNQYFFNSSGQNCFATLQYFKQKGMTKEANILEEAINLINPKKLSEQELIENLRTRKVIELEDSIINSKLEILDKKFYK